MEGKDSQSDENERRRRCSLEHNLRVVKADDASEGDSLEEGEQPEEKDIGGRRTPLPVRREHRSDGAEARDEHQPGVGARPVDDGVAGHEPPDEGGREDLDGEDAVDAADEGLTDLDGGLGDGLADL